MKTENKKTIKFIIMTLSNVLIILIAIFLFTKMTSDALSKIGSMGDEVKAIQQKLTEIGLFSDNIDGIYGSKTENAVKLFQKNNGLNADGVAGPQTLKRMGIESSQQSNQVNASNSEVQLLGRIISAEARGEPYLGQIGVGAVILNRIESPSFPDTLSGVIYEGGAFTAIVDGQFNEPVADSALKAAKEALNGQDPTGGAIYYYNPKKTSNAFIISRPIIKQIGSHLFCN